MSLQFPSGPVPLNSPFYIDRPPIEALAYGEIDKPGSVTRIKAPQKMGKSSLILRILNHAAELEYRTVNLDFQQVEEAVLTDLNKLLRWLCANVTRQLRLPSMLDEYWDEDIGSKISCTLYFQEYILAEKETPLVLVLNEVNRIFEYPKIAKEFLPLLRSWHEEAKQEETMQKLRLVVSHSTEIYVPLNINQSPFNVGLPIKLSNFTLEQVRDLSSRYQISGQDSIDYSVSARGTGQNQLKESETEKLMATVGGHPYLVQLAFYYLYQQKLTVDMLLQNASTESGIYRNHLRSHWGILEKQPEMMTALKQVVNANNPVVLKPLLAYKLESMGLITIEGNNCLPSCELYRLYFRGSNLDILELNSALVKHLELENRRLQNLSEIDELTQLPNRRTFDQHLLYEWQNSARNNSSISTIMCDIDFFKNYNDTYGHLAGDDCLRQIAITLRQTIKGQTDLVARYGGEEFVVILPGTDAFMATFIAEKIREEVKALNIPHSSSQIEQRVVTISAGVACTIANLEDEADILLRAADEALYESKAKGRDRISVSSTLDYGLLD